MINFNVNSRDLDPSEADPDPILAKNRGSDPIPPRKTGSKPTLLQNGTGSDLFLRYGAGSKLTTLVKRTLHFEILYAWFKLRSD